jgi:hypothetical protein
VRALTAALELAREGVPLNIIQRQLGHANLGTTSIYLRGIDPEEIIATVHLRRAPRSRPAPGFGSDREPSRRWPPPQLRSALATAELPDRACARSHQPPRRRSGRRDVTAVTQSRYEGGDCASWRSARGAIGPDRGKVASIQVMTGPLEDERRSEALFGGDLLIFKDVAPLQRFSTLVGEFLGAVFGDAPQHAQFDLSPEEFTARASDLVERCRRHPAALQGFREVLRHVGLDLDRTYWDWLHLRIQPHQDFTEAGTLGYHRDTWSSNIDAQTNWWTPVLPITRERTIALYPAYWSRRLANTSASWDLQRVREMPLVPSPSEPVDADSEVRIVIEPGDLLCFSGAHLHASVPNTSGATRFSVEVRTVTADDVRAGRGAPNVDGEAPRVAWRWFRGITSSASLADLAETQT